MFLCPNCFYIPKFKIQTFSTWNDFIIQSKCSCGNIPLRLEQFFNNYLIDLLNPKCNLNKKFILIQIIKESNYVFFVKKFYVKNVV